MSTPTQWERMGMPTQCDMLCDTFVVSIMRKVKLGRLASETVGLHAEFSLVFISLRKDGVAGIKRRRRDLYGDGVRNFVMASGRGRLKEDLESSTWQRRQDF
ncbi:hypothetical protein Tco_0985008 [Tanacetum coccineum]